MLPPGGAPKPAAAAAGADGAAAADAGGARERSNSKLAAKLGETRARSNSKLGDNSAADRLKQRLERKKGEMIAERERRNTMAMTEADDAARAAAVAQRG